MMVLSSITILKFFLPNWGKYPNLPRNPWKGDSQDQETFLAPSADKQTHNDDKECSRSAQITILPNHQKAMGLSRSKMKRWAM